jgi:hypothetical protein
MPRSKASYAPEVERKMGGRVVAAEVSGDRPRLEQPRRRHAERRGDLVQDEHGRVSDAALDAADLGPVQAAFESELLLRPAGC